MIRIFKSSIIRQVLSDDELNSLVEDFKSYKLTGIAPMYFGRDVLYDHPNTLPIVLTEEVQHIHLGSEGKPFPPGKFSFIAQVIFTWYIARAGWMTTAIY